MPEIEDHPLRYALANELHARPFPRISAPSCAAFLALKVSERAAARDRNLDLQHLIRLLDHYGAPHPQPNATHYSGDIGRYKLMWENHNEFVTYMVLQQGNSSDAFDPKIFDALPKDWLTEAPGVRMTSGLIRVERSVEDDEIVSKLSEWFVPESLAVSRVVDNNLVVATDYRIDPAGHIRIAAFVQAQTSETRIGRVILRLCEIEIYKSMSMLGLARVRQLNPELSDIVNDLASAVDDMCGDATDAPDTLKSLLGISAQLENLVAQSSFRFSATAAYEKLVHERIEVLREERFGGRQTLAEFMLRRFDPSMRTVKSTQERLQATTLRAVRAADLLRTRVDVERSGQNQKLLESMDKRADLQLRLQGTVEGLSVVAISYYAVSLVLYVLGPLEYQLGISKAVLAAVATPVVLIAVWAMVRRIKRKIH